MISRLTTLAAAFAVLTTAALAFAASTPQRHHAERASVAQAMPLIQLERVEVIGHRTAPVQR